jgi:N-acetylglucosaminyldiphosphoundecaprenol N-acetyl-beta-D-mannosaminyltransferase
MGLSTLIDIVVARPELNFDAQAQSALLCRIVAAKPSILVLTLGAPVSEIFVHQNVRALPPCWVLCVGQALRVELRLARRAPVIWQELGLEWLWRLQNEPSRLIGRYARALAWFPIAIWRDLAGREPAQDC